MHPGEMQKQNNLNQRALNVDPRSFNSGFRFHL